MGIFTPGRAIRRQTQLSGIGTCRLGIFLGEIFRRNIAVFFCRTREEPNNRSVWEVLGRPKTGLGLLPLHVTVQFVVRASEFPDPEIIKV